LFGHVETQSGPFVLILYIYAIDRNQSDLRRSKLKSCKCNFVEQTSIV